MHRLGLPGRPVHIGGEEGEGALRGAPVLGPVPPHPADGVPVLVLLPQPDPRAALRGPAAFRRGFDEFRPRLPQQRRRDRLRPTSGGAAKACS